MHEQNPHDGRPALTDMQRDRIDFARRDLGNARSVSLSDLPKSGLVLLISTLTRRLDDVVGVVDEICAPPTDSPDVGE
jgi:hypothetical protein